MSEARVTLQALVADIVANPPSAHGYEATDVEFGESVEVTLRKDGADFVLWLRPATHSTPCYRQIGRLKIGHRGEPPDRLGYALLDAACLVIEAWERTLSDEAHSQLFDAPSVRKDPRGNPTIASFRDSGRPALEWLAVRSGLKPACRYVVRPDEARRIVEHARVDGLFARVTDAKAFVEDFCGEGAKHGMTTLVHVGRSDRAAAVAADAERAMIDACTGGRRVADDHVRALGAALGYPSCCVEAFLPMRDLSAAAIRFHALQRTTGRAELVLNDVFEERALVSHCLCRYDCAPSLRYARALLEELHRIDPVAADELVQDLTGLIVLFRTGGSLRCAPVTHPASGTYMFERVEEAGTGPLFEVWRRAFSTAIGLEIVGDEVRVLRGTDASTRLNVPSDDVQIRVFAPQA